MAVIFSVALLILISSVQGFYRLEDAIRNYEREYGLVFDSAAVLSDHYARPDHRSDYQQPSEISGGVLQLGMDIESQTTVRSDEKARIYSPLSIASTLSVLQLGSNGETFKELMDIWSFSKDSQFFRNPYKFHENFGRVLRDLRRNYRQQPNAYRTNLANGIFIRDGLTMRPEFKSASETIYKSEVSTLDFRGTSEMARDHINNWVKTKTNGKIQDILSESVPADTAMLIVSALYFRGLWKTPFSKLPSKLMQNFYPDGINAEPISVEMMHMTEMLPYYESKEYDCSIIGLPYKENQATMFIILPNNSSRQRLIEFQDELSASVIEDMIARMKMHEIGLFLPKMHLKASTMLTQTLNDMGIKTLFDRDECDLSLMVASDDNSRNRKDENVAKLGDESHVFSRIDDIEETPVKYEVNRRRRWSSYSNPRMNAAKILDVLRDSEDLPKPDMFVQDILHTIDLSISEGGTEGAAVTMTSINRVDVDVLHVDSPFLLLVRHTSTSLPLFYGSVFDPRN